MLCHFVCVYGESTDRLHKWLHDGHLQGLQRILTAAQLCYASQDRGQLVHLLWVLHESWQWAAESRKV